MAEEMVVIAARQGTGGGTPHEAGPMKVGGRLRSRYRIRRFRGRERG